MYTPPALPFPIVSDLISIGVDLLILAMIARAVLSMMRIDEGYAIVRFIARITDPFINPLRRIIKQVWIIDISFLVALFLLITLETLLIQSLPAGW